MYDHITSLDHQAAVSNHPLLMDLDTWHLAMYRALMSPLQFRENFREMYESETQYMPLHLARTCMHALIDVNVVIMITDPPLMSTSSLCSLAPSPLHPTDMDMLFPVNVWWPRHAYSYYFTSAGQYFANRVLFYRMPPVLM
jgi:hypothetical protein